MVDNLTAGAILRDKLSSTATDILHRLDQSVQRLAKGKPAENAPVTYKVTHKGGALVRSGYDTQTPQVHQLDVGEIVTVVELHGRRARIITPVDGWVSTETKEGVVIMKPHSVSSARKQEVFEAAFEQKFSRLKAQSQKGSPLYDPRAEGGYGERARSESPEDRARDKGRSEEEDRAQGRHRDWEDDRRPPSKSGPSGGAIPRLAAPGSAQGPIALAPPPSSRSSAAARGSRDAAPNAASQSSAPPASKGGSLDLLDLGSESAAQSSKADVFDPFGGKPANTPFDPFGTSSVPPAAPAPTGDWDAFQAAPVGRGPAQAPWSPATGQASTPAWNAFGGPTQPAFPGPMGGFPGPGGYKAAPAPVAQGFPGSYAVGAMGTSQSARAGVEDLMSRAMAGVDNLGFDQRSVGPPQAGNAQVNLGQPFVR